MQKSTKKEQLLHMRFFQAKREVFEDKILQNVEYWVEKNDPNNQVNIDGFTDQLTEFIILLLQRTELQSSEMNWKVEEVLPGGKSPDLEILVGIVDNYALDDPSVLEKLITNSKLRLTADATSRRLDPTFISHPMIFIGVDNLMEVGTKEEPNKKLPQHKLIDNIHLRIDPRFRVLDSSIWNRYVPLVQPKEFKRRLQSAVQDILLYYEKGLYNTIVAQEYLEFQCRKLRESYVKNYPGGHAKKVTPFRFHSESKMKVKANAILKKLGPYQWGCLLVDDYASKPLRTMDKNQSNTTSKLDWIDHLVNKTSINSEGSPRTIATFINPEEKEWKDNERPSHVKDHKNRQKYKGYIDYFIQSLRKVKEPNVKRPDIIILDYFFGIQETNPEEQYGHKFIKRLAKFRNPEAITKEEVLLPDETLAFGRYWIFPISAFEHAFRSHLRLMGDSAGNEVIKMGDGADPVNSPELFRYLFYSFLLEQEKRVGIGLGALVEKVMGEIPPSGKRNLKPVIANHFHEFTELITKFRRLDAEKDISIFTMSYLKIIDESGIMGRLCTHIQNLAHLIGFGSAWDWPRMWQELTTIKDLYQSLSIKGKHKAGQRLQIQFDKGKELLNEIENYIIDLQKTYG